MLYDEMIHGTWASSRPSHGAPVSDRPSRIAEQTPIIPRAVAEGVWEEATVWLGEELPRHWIAELVTRAETVYAHNAKFRRQMRAKSNAGRDWLWAFNRHWLAELIQRHRPELHRRLPASYNVGQPLPATHPTLIAS